MKIFLILLFLSATLSVQSQETIKLESTISGNQEQPQVLYMVPWKIPDSPTLKFDAINRSFHTIFEHLERDELRRQLQSSVIIDETPKHIEQQSD